MIPFFGMSIWSEEGRLRRIMSQYENIDGARNIDYILYDIQSNISERGLDVSKIESVYCDNKENSCIVHCSNNGDKLTMEVNKYAGLYNKVSLDKLVDLADKLNKNVYLMIHGDIKYDGSKNRFVLSKEPLFYIITDEKSKFRLLYDLSRGNKILLLRGKYVNNIRFYITDLDGIKNIEFYREYGISNLKEIFDEYKKEEFERIGLKIYKDFVLGLKLDYLPGYKEKIKVYFKGYEPIEISYLGLKSLDEDHKNKIESIKIEDLTDPEIKLFLKLLRAYADIYSKTHKKDRPSSGLFGIDNGKDYGAYTFVYGPGINDKEARRLLNNIFLI